MTTTLLTLAIVVVVQEAYLYDLCDTCMSKAYEDQLL